MPGRWTALGHSKGVLMKAGQIFSMVDLGAVGNGELSPYQKALTRLQADAPPMDPQLAKDVVAADLGRPAAEVFAEFSGEPMAAASIGQVHRATLHDGRQVVVKIQYPGVAEAIRDDMANGELVTTFFRFASSVSGSAIPDIRVAAREITARISEEIDYRHEARNITAFGDLYRDHPFIHVPELIPQACGDRVLTMTYLDGLDWTAAQQADQDLKNAWAETIWRFAGGAFRHANLVHADPHPGNYRFGLDGHVGFVDFGCVKVLPERSRRSSVELWRAVLDGRRIDLRDQMVESGILTTDSAMTPDEAWEWYAELLHEWRAPQPVTFTREAPARVIRGVIDIRPPEHPFRRMLIPSDLVFFGRVNLNINAICAALHATFYARAMIDDLDGVAEPITPLGKQHVAWVRQRGLPFGLGPR
jgi:predicted unusual protein kinase regulating ubiquinone biosynthesis (AarF/ABC1/UbiB family)